MSAHAGFLAGIITAFMIALLATMTEEWAGELAERDSIYCEMTQIHVDTGGEYGWPDYNGNREVICRGVSR